MVGRGQTLPKHCFGHLYLTSLIIALTLLVQIFIYRVLEIALAIRRKTIVEPSLSKPKGLYQRRA
jgi:hypothetical protein